MIGAGRATGVGDLSCWGRLGRGFVIPHGSIDQSERMNVGWTVRGPNNRWSWINRRGKEPGLEIVNGTFEFSQSDSAVLLTESILDMGVNLGMFQNPLIGCLGTVVTPSDMTSRADLIGQFHHPLKEVDVESE